MKTNEHAPRTDEVMLAFAELDRLERDRAEFAAAKHDARERLDAAKTEIDDLRERLHGERPRAWARVRKAQLDARAMRERAAADALAAAEVEHQERLANMRTELEARRLRLAAMEATPAPERPTRRLLEWSVPTAATALVAVFAIALLGAEHEAEAHPMETPVLHAVEVDELPAYPAAVAPYAIEREAPPAPEVEPEPEKKKKKANKTKAKTKAKTPKADTSKKVDTNPRANKLILSNDGGNPLG